MYRLQILPITVWVWHVILTIRNYNIMDKELIEKLEKHINDKLEKEYKIELPFYEFGTFSYELAQEIEKLLKDHKKR